MSIGINSEMRELIIVGDIKEHWKGIKKRWEEKHVGKNLEEAIGKSKFDKYFGKFWFRKTILMMAENKLHQSTIRGKRIYPKQEIKALVSEFVDQKFREIYGK